MKSYRRFITFAALGCLYVSGAAAGDEPGETPDPAGHAARAAAHSSVAVSYAGAASVATLATAGLAVTHVSAATAEAIWSGRERQDRKRKPAQPYRQYPTPAEAAALATKPGQARRR